MLARLRDKLGITSLEQEVREASRTLADLREGMAEAGDRLNRVDQLLADRSSATDGAPPAVSVGPDLLTYENLIGLPPAPERPPPAARRRSALCAQADFALDAYRFWINAFGERPKLHRKQWEYFYICQSLYERGMLSDGRRGLGFGVGTEPLPALFARMGCRIVATDQERTAAERSGWLNDGQHADGVADLNTRGLCPSDVLADRVTFQVVDMNQIPHELDEQFDFCWSSCCLEHLGSIEHDLDFIKNSMKTLRPGGIAVHTTEFNLSFSESTFESRDLSLYRRNDIDRIIRELEGMCCRAEPVQWTTSEGLAEVYVDLPPYREQPHLRLRLEGYSCTSIGLIVQRLSTDSYS